MKKTLQKSGITLLMIAFFAGIGSLFFVQNARNYDIYKQSESVIIHHPEFIPNSESSKIISFGFTNIFADMYWLRTIQYIGGNAISGEYKKYLAVMMNIITDLNPYFESPYTIGELLIPSSAGSYDDTTNPENFKDYQEAVALGLKGVKNFCNSELIDAIQKQDNLAEIYQSPVYKNPCKSYKIPYYLAFIYYFYLHENLQAAKYYKVVTAQEDAPEGARVLAAIMQGKGGDREKSIYMFLSLAQASENQDEACSILTQEVQNAYNTINQNTSILDGNFISALQTASQKIIPLLSKETEQKALADTQCTNFLGKAIREINLLYLDTANEKYKSDHNGENAKDPETLLGQGYISFNPTDFQRYSDDEYGIIYIYNSDIGRFDYEMGYVGLPEN